MYYNTLKNVVCNCDHLSFDVTPQKKEGVRFQGFFSVILFLEKGVSPLKCRHHYQHDLLKNLPNLLENKTFTTKNSFSLYSCGAAMDRDLSVPYCCVVL